MPKAVPKSKPELKPRANAAPTKQQKPAYLPALLICCALLLATVAVYFQVHDFDFVNYDDDKFIIDEPMVQRGLTAESIRWAFTSGAEEYWIPLTKLSRLLDQSLFGSDPGMHHLTNVVIHILAAWALFAFLYRATGARWSSALVAFLFSLHPLHVESVAWVTERKDVLFGLFAFVTFWIYTRYAERPRLPLFLAALAAFALSIMSKPMAVTVPCVLLLLDIWPLRRLTLSGTFQLAGNPRIPPVSWPRALAEKLPFFVVTAAAGVATLYFQRLAGATAYVEHLSFGFRLANALVAYVVYILNTLWPTNLAAFYPLPPDVPFWQTALALLTLALISLLAFRNFKNHPYLAIGWLWFLGTLVPASGLLQQVGIQARGDRYTYMPLVGLFLIAAWGSACLVHRKPHLKTTVVAVLSLACVASAVASFYQIRHWRNSGTLWSHALASGHRSWVAHGNLGMYLKDQGQFEPAILEFTRSLEINPNYPKHRRELGAALTKVGRLEESLKHTREALKLNPADAAAYNNLGVALSEMPGRGLEAVAAYEQALRYKPDFLMAHSNLAVALAGYPERRADAIRHFEAALRLKPDSPEVHFNFGTVLAGIPGRRQEAASHFQTALSLSPGLIQARQQLELLRNTPE